MEKFRKVLAMFGGQLLRPVKTTSDLVIPIHSDDDTSMHRANVMHVMMRFDKALQVEKLQSALHELLARPGWNKWSGRIRLNVGCNSL